MLELGGQELDELIETDQPARTPSFDEEDYDEEPTMADDVVGAPGSGSAPSQPASDPNAGLRTGPGIAPERTEQINADFINNPQSISLELTPQEPSTQETASLRVGGARQSARHQAVQPQPQPAAQPAAPAPRREIRERRRTDSEERVDEMLGQTLGSYTIISLLGEGGMGRVYLAEHIKLGRKVALKLLRPEYAVKRDAVRRFFQEAKAVNRIGHENIVDITDLLELDEGYTFIIMELLQGEDLADVQRGSDSPMPLHRAMRISLQVCDALVAAHKVGVVHRDLKPDNIYIVNTETKRDFVKLLDFGVAKLFNQEDDGFQTAVGSVIGTPAYMSPEQATGIPVDNRSDIYSLGAIMYEVFTGHPVFRAKSFGEFVVKHMNDEPIPPRDLADAPKIPAALEMVILRCLEKDPDRRYQTVEDLRDDLSRATATVETAVKQNPLLAADRKAPAKSSRKWIVIVPMALAILALALAAFLLAAGVFEGDPVVRTAPAGSARTGRAARQRPPPKRVPAPPAKVPAKASVAKAEPIPAAPTKPAPPAVKVGSVTLRLHTQPPGAEVFRKDRPGRSLGRTPVSLVLSEIGQEIAFLFRLKGHTDHVELVKVADGNSLVSVALERRAPVAAAPRVRGTTTKLKTAPRPRPAKARPKARPKTRPQPKAARPRPGKAVKPKPVKKKKIKANDQIDPFAQ